MELTNGTYLKGENYKILSKISQGNFGITYLAEQTNLERHVCIKEYFFRGYCERTEEQRITITSTGREVADSFKRKFKKEALRLSQFNHPNIVKVIDIFDENDTVYMVMEFVKGETLQQIVDRKGRFTEQEAIPYIIPICNALELVHQKGLLHLDIKPSNIIIEETSNIPVLIDFGVSKYIEQGDQESHTTTPVALTKGYAPLEQYGQDLKSLTVATDVYSVAATLYKLVTGITPPEPSVIIQNGIKSPKDYNPKLTYEISKVIMQALSYKIEQRPQSIRELKNYFDQLPLTNNEKDKETLTEVLAESIPTRKLDENLDTPKEAIPLVEEKSKNSIKSESYSKLKVFVSIGAILIMVVVVVYFYLNQNVKRDSLFSTQQFSLKNSADSAAYAIGVDLGNNIRKNLPQAPGGNELDQSLILDAFSSVINGDLIIVDSTQAGAITQAYFVKAQTKSGDTNKEDGQKFLAYNRMRTGVTTTDSGLQYEVLKVGDGPKPKIQDSVKVHYHGTTIDGVVFDSSVDRGEPVTFGLTQVIKGWTEALQLMPVGSKWKIFIPSDLGYGDKAAGPKIKPYSVLIFEIELLGIEK